MENSQVLELASGFPLRIARPGEIIIQEDSQSPELLILEEGTVEVRREGSLVAVVGDPGSTLGEISMLLDSPSTADVVARGEVRLRVVANPEALFSEHPELSLFVARELAERLARVTAFLAELKEEVGDADGQMGLVPQVVSELLAWRRLTADVADSTTDEQADAIDLTDSPVAATGSAN